MSNNAVRILYSALNALPTVRCERVFAPAKDFEALLRDSGLPLYTLENGIPLRDADVLAFSVGYELCATNILTVLDLGGITLDARDRGPDEPIVIAGGPAVTNPHPLARFLDAVWIGEAEAGFFRLAEDLAIKKKAGASRADLLGRMETEESFWMKGKKALRAVDMDFPGREYELRFPWPSLKPVQDHGTVEIMRGCPNGCRFCHAGYFYRPQRVREPERIFREVEDLVTRSGYREITLASLSSGDYPELPSLIRELNRRWASRRVSFQLPSLRVESFTLPVLAELTQTRKSGLTFAVETPEEAGQRSVNKTASLEKILAILAEAGSQGYRLAKFYFMLGLPVGGSSVPEERSLVEFLGKLLAATSLQLNVNIGTFIPKPHTPYQWCRQIGEDEALGRINYVRNAFRSERRLKISYHSPFVSLLEGLLSRGDERAGELVLDAWKEGARLDAWEDLLNRDAWRSALSRAPLGFLEETLGERDTGKPLPWDDVSLRIGRAAFLREFDRSGKGILTPACEYPCTDPCGVCGMDRRAVIKNIHSIIPQERETDKTRVVVVPALKRGESSCRSVLRFSKTGSSAYLPHHSILDFLYRALQLGAVPVVFSEGYNPIPRLEIEEPIPLGMESLDDYAGLLLSSDMNSEVLRESLNRFLPSGISIADTRIYPLRKGAKTRSLSAIHWGSDYRIGCSQDSMLECLGDFLSDERLKGSGVFPGEDESSCVVRLKSGGNREVGFGALFKKAFGISFAESEMPVVRLVQWADIGRGPERYFDALKALHNI